jgi:hypothetical protein
VVTVVDHVGQWFIDGQIFDHITSIKGASNGRRAAVHRRRSARNTAARLQAHGPSAFPLAGVRLGD